VTHISARPEEIICPIDDHGEPCDLTPGNILLPEGTAPRWSIPLILLGVVLLAVTVIAPILNHDLLKHALAAYHIGMVTVLAASLGAMFWVMGFHLTMAGWPVTIRRQFENLMMLAPLAGLGVLLLLVFEMWTGGHLYSWMQREMVQGDPIYSRKAGFLNPLFFTVRSLLYVAVWGYLAWKLRGYSVEQDRTGDRWLSNKARFTSSWGMLAFALTTAFAAFDWIMSMDYRFFSTMWGVYYFAGAAFCSVPVIVLLLSWIQSQGRLRGLVSREHYHDLGKLMFGFTVFWAYIGFSQYFLIWYANIPEETFWMLARKQGPWHNWTVLLCVGHFVVPFWVLLWKFVRRTNMLLGLVAAWMILMEIADMVWIVRPLVYGGAGAGFPVHPERIWLDVAGIAGAWLLFMGLLIRSVGAGPLIPTRDPRLPESLQHRNYV